VLKRGGALGLLADRAVTGVGERVPFFGRPALLPSAHVVLALRTGASLVPGFAYRDGRKMRAVFEPALELARTGDREADVREGVRRWAQVLERHIREAPEQWSVFEAVWRR
jgi:lauroyl/myristoyl acyltransferase